MDDEKPVNYAVDEKQTEKTSLTSATFNLTKAAIGAGTLFIPYTFRLLGMFGGTGMLFFAALACAATLHFLGRLSVHTGEQSYFGLGRLAFGPAGESVAMGTVLVFLLAGMTLYSFKIGFFLARPLQGWLYPAGKQPFWVGERAWIVLASLAVGPLALLKDMRRLAYSSLIGLAFIFYVVVLTVFDAFLGHGQVAGAAEPFHWFKVPTFLQFFTAFASILFAYVNHFTLVQLVPQLDRPSRTRRWTLVGLSTFLSWLFYTTVGVFGYAHFGEKTGADILATPTNHPAAYSLGQLAIGAMLVCSYPLLAAPARDAFLHLLRVGKPSRLVHTAVSLGFVALTTTVAAAFTDSALDILNFFCTLCGSPLVFIFPALYFLRLKGRVLQVGWAETVAAWCMVVLGGVTL